MPHYARPLNLAAGVSPSAAGSGTGVVFLHLEDDQWTTPSQLLVLLQDPE